VLGRKVEEAIYDVLVSTLSGRGVETLHATYAPTKKNGMVAEHFDRLGLRRVAETVGGVRRYEASIADYVPPELPMKIELFQDVRTRG